MFYMFVEHLQIDWIIKTDSPVIFTDSDVVYSLRIEYKAWTQERAQKTWNTN